MILGGRAISPGKVTGTVLIYPEPFSFLGGVDGSTGKLNVADGNISGKIFVFPNGKGSTVGSYVVYDLMVHGCAPAALINRTAETIVTTGAVISGVPMVDDVDISLLRDGDIVTVDGNKGTVDIEGVGCCTAVILIVKNGDRILMKRQNARSHTHAGKLVPVYELAEDVPQRGVLSFILEQKGIPVVPGSPVEFFARGKHTVYDVFLYSVECDLESIPEGYEWIDIGKVNPEDIVPGFESVLKRL